jgi:hypothetical protein
VTGEDTEPEAAFGTTNLAADDAAGRQLNSSANVANSTVPAIMRVTRETAVILCPISNRSETNLTQTMIRLPRMVVSSTAALKPPVRRRTFVPFSDPFSEPIGRCTIILYAHETW